MGEAAAPASASLLIVSVKGGYDARPGWECNPFERSCASSFPDNPTGTDIIRCNDSGEPPEESGWGWEKSI
jgi:hypothetical protein